MCSCSILVFLHLKKKQPCIASFPGSPCHREGGESLHYYSLEPRPSSPSFYLAGRSRGEKSGPRDTNLGEEGLGLMLSLHLLFVLQVTKAGQRLGYEAKPCI